MLISFSLLVSVCVCVCRKGGIAAAAAAGTTVVVWVRKLYISYGCSDIFLIRSSVRTG